MKSTGTKIIFFSFPQAVLDNHNLNQFLTKTTDIGQTPDGTLVILTASILGGEFTSVTPRLGLDTYPGTFEASNKFFGRRMPPKLKSKKILENFQKSPLGNLCMYKSEAKPHKNCKKKIVDSKGQFNLKGRR